VTKKRQKGREVVAREVGGGKGRRDHLGESLRRVAGPVYFTIESESSGLPAMSRMGTKEFMNPNDDYDWDFR
jgi:hypothetical protein